MLTKIPLTSKIRGGRERGGNLDEVTQGIVALGFI